MKTIGMIVPTVDNIFFAKIAYEAEKFLKERGYLTFIASCQNKAGNEKDYVKKMQEVCDGILCISGLEQIEEGLIKTDYPFVLIDRTPKSGQDFAVCANDDYEACRNAVEFLIEKGCEKIVLCPGYLAQGQTAPRLEGYCRALEDNGLPFREQYVIRRSGTHNSEQETEQRIEELLHDGEQIDGIIASSDRAAFGAITALEKVGCYVPEDVKLITFDKNLRGFATDEVLARAAVGHAFLHADYGVHEHLEVRAADAVGQCRGACRQVSAGREAHDAHLAGIYAQAVGMAA